MPIALIVEDDKHIRILLRSALESESWTIVESDNLKRGSIDAGSRKPDVIILDLGLPDGNGIELILQIRSYSNVPIIVLSARSDESDKIMALDAGADDYLTKPFGIGEFLARLRANLRRPRSSGKDNNFYSIGKDIVDGIFKFGQVEVNFVNRTIKRDGIDVHLTPIEYRLLSVLISNVGRVLTQKQILNEVWGPSAVDQSHYLRIYMGHLRQKLEIDSAQPKYLLTETGVGYRLIKN